VSREEWEQQQEVSNRNELESLSHLSASELIRLIESGRFGLHQNAFDALATKGDIRLIVPFLAAQLNRPLSVSLHERCAIALLSMLPYSGIPAYAVANPSHPGHTIYREDLAAHIEATLKRLELS
jgi:hypothetical protein